jgi:hypothetical protein
MKPCTYRVWYIKTERFEYLIVALSVWPVDPALVNAISIAIVISRAHLNNAKHPIVKCPLG